MYKPNLSPSPELSYILGVFYGDGSTTYEDSPSQPGYKYRIRLSAGDRNFVEEFARCLSEVTGRDEIPVTERNIAGGETEGYRTRVCCKALYQFIESDLKEHEGIIEENPAPFIRGFFDSEGSADSNRVRAVSTDKRILEYIRGLLARFFSISSHIWSEEQMGKGEKTRFVLQIKEQNSLDKFWKEIGLACEKKIPEEMAEFTG